MRFGVAVFPGSNCDHDCYHVVKHVLGQEARFVWHKETALEDVDCLIVPGGFAYGDYLRAGAIARFSPVMKAVENFASDGGLVLGICNGFQILVEAGLLPGAMIRNRSLKFICRYVHLKLENDATPYTCLGNRGDVFRMPIAHREGNYQVDGETLRRLNEEGQVVFRYCDQEGEVTEEANPNGSLGNIAGICNSEGNVMGMMPHPERCAEGVLGSEDGAVIFRSIIHSLSRVDG